MGYVIGGLAGLAWGALAAFVNLQINRRALEKNSTNAMLAANTGRMAVNITSLAAIVLLRKVLPFRYEAALVGTAVALSLLTIVFAYRLSRPSRKPEAEETDEETKQDMQ